MVQVSSKYILCTHLKLECLKCAISYFDNSSFHTYVSSFIFVNRWYKTPDDKPLNGFGFDEKYLNAAESEKVIAETHEAWKKLKAGEAEAGKLWVN